jgi:hypothetical protein
VSTVGRTPAGATRTCPHCRAVILQSSTACPSCKKHLRFTPGGDAMLPTFSPLRVDGSIRHPNVGEAWEYSVLVTITNDKGEEVGRQIVGVGALNPGEGRTFSVAVEVFKPNMAPTATPADDAVLRGLGQLTPSTRRIR